MIFHRLFMGRNSGRPAYGHHGRSLGHTKRKCCARDGPGELVIYSDENPRIGGVRTIIRCRWPKPHGRGYLIVDRVEAARFNEESGYRPSKGER